MYHKRILTVSNTFLSVNYDQMTLFSYTTYILLMVASCWIASGLFVLLLTCHYWCWLKRNRNHIVIIFVFIYRESNQLQRRVLSETQFSLNFKAFLTGLELVSTHFCVIMGNGAHFYSSISTQIFRNKHYFQLLWFWLVLSSKVGLSKLHLVIRSDNYAHTFLSGIACKALNCCCFDIQIIPQNELWGYAAINTIHWSTFSKGVVTNSLHLPHSHSTLSRTCLDIKW